ncbi:MULTISPECIES: hypothetical protein [Rhizobium]|uniref:ElaB/YqjD/DUF883 family membrane-anchored ribosome-binding protein n=1 Tax=Rhizobium wenxiniae TaxID=1737357 RepID=A0A7W9YA29_9HYPH|nr:hypothetical protein [Rhizobium wenxiniae]MBB6164759.1 ElaB/YqjD/DUF883 family membrane-anchored ribosome-binding protein [Rhizobium wenxiniae]GGG05971.1 hypothetical protein GCM10010924_38280 [Rhizobium wenxiniae]
MKYDPNLGLPAQVEDLETKDLAIPVSAKSPSTSVSRPLHTSDAPRVDQALRSVLEHRNDPYVEPKERFSALQEEVDSLRYRASDEVRVQIRNNPWQAVGIAVLAGFLLGIAR